MCVCMCAYVVCFACVVYVSMYLYVSCVYAVCYVCRAPNYVQQSGIIWPICGRVCIYPEVLPGQVQKILNGDSCGA